MPQQQCCHDICKFLLCLDPSNLINYQSILRISQLKMSQVFIEMLSRWSDLYDNFFLFVGTPLLVGTMLLPFEVVDQGTEILGSFVFGKMKAIIAVSLGLPVIYLLYYFGPLKYMFGMLRSALTFIYHALGYFSAIWVSENIPFFFSGNILLLLCRFVIIL